MSGEKTGMRLVLAIACAFAVTACDRLTGYGDDDSLEEFKPEHIFERGEYELADNDPKRAAWYFSEIERLYPYSSWAKRALIMQAYAHHQDRNYSQSRLSAQRYIDFYPADEDAAYAQYLLALSYYDQIDEIGRDQDVTVKALRALRTVFEVYPESEFATSASLKFDLAFDHLAGKEMEVGRYYLRHGHYGAAINRFKTVVENFGTTTHTPEALYRLVEAYLLLGLDAEAQTAGAILGHNFRSTEWYESGYRLLTEADLDAKPRGEGWLRKVYRRMIKGQWL